MSEPPSREAVCRRISDWLEAERASVLVQLQKSGLAETVRVEVPTASDITETSVSFSSEIREANPLTVGVPAWRVLQGRERPPATPRELLHRTYGGRCWYQTLSTRPDFLVELLAWIDEHLLRPISIVFLQSLPRLSEPSRSRALEVAGELVDLIEGDTVLQRTRLPLGGLRIHETLRHGPISVRWLESEEVGQLNYTDILQGGEFRSLLGFRQSFGARTMLEIEERLPKRTWRQPTGLVQRIVLALQLMGFEPFGNGRAAEREYPIAQGTRGTPVSMPLNGTWRELGQSDLERAIVLAGRIPQETVTDPRSPQTIALSRYGSACGDRTSTDALIDFVVALEAVLLGEHEGELRFRFALYGSYATGADANHRPGLFREFTEIYDTRSKIVHGRRVGAADLQRVAATARHLTARVLQRGLEQGWLSQDDLRAAVLSSQ